MVEVRRELAAEIAKHGRGVAAPVLLRNSPPRATTRGNAGLDNARQLFSFCSLALREGSLAVFNAI
jgi:hypothetical protein